MANSTLIVFNYLLLVWLTSIFSDAVFTNSLIQCRLMIKLIAVLHYFSVGKVPMGVLMFQHFTMFLKETHS